MMKTIMRVITVLLLVGVLFGSFGVGVGTESVVEETSYGVGYYLEKLSVVSEVSAEKCPDGSSGC